MPDVIFVPLPTAPSSLTSAMVEEAFEIAYSALAHKLGKTSLVEGEDAWDAIGGAAQNGFKAAIVALAKETQWPIDPTLG